MKRRDFLKSCGAALGMATAVEGVQVLPPLYIYDPTTKTYSTASTVYKSFDYKSKPDTFESLAEEFGWEFTDPDGIDGIHDIYMMRHIETSKCHLFRVRLRKYERGHLSSDLPLREQFIVETAIAKARSACQNDTIKD